MATASNSVKVIRFGVFELDLPAGELRKSGLKIKLQEQPFQVLAMLLRHPGEVVTREELQKSVWPEDTFVDFDRGLNKAVNKIREALGDSADNPRFVETLPRRGYRFIAPVDVGAGLMPAVPSADAMPTPAGRPQEPGLSAPKGARLHSAREPVRRMRWAFRAAALVAMLVAGLGVVWFVWHRASRPGGQAAAGRVESLAVLPLENLSGNKEEDFFADGMTDELITDLGKISALRVISRTSVMQYRGAKKPLSEIARELNVDAVVEGTVLRSGDRVRITAQLIRAVPEKHLWAESYERDLRDVLVLQEEVARAIANEVQIKLAPQERARLASARPLNPEVYEAYLKGRFMWSKLSEEGFRKGIEYFQQAIEKDPTYAPAYVGLADCYWKLAGFVPPEEAYRKSKAAVEKALALDNTLGEAHATRAQLAFQVDWDWPVAEREHKRALELNPSNAMMHAWYGAYLMGMNRQDEALAEIRRAQAIDPISLDTDYWVVMLLYSARQYDQAIEHARKICELYPDDSAGPYWLATLYEQKGMYPEAEENYLRFKALEGASKEQVTALRHSYLTSGMRGYRDKELELIEAGSTPLYTYVGDIARNYAMLGDKERAFQWLEKAYKLHDTSLVGLKIDPRFDNLHRDPRYEDLLRRVGFPP